MSKTRGQKTYTKLEIAEECIRGTGLKIPDPTWASSQISTMLKYHTLSTPRLAKKVGVPVKVVANFKRIFRNRKIKGWNV